MSSMSEFEIPSPILQPVTLPGELGSEAAYNSLVKTLKLSKNECYESSTESVAGSVTEMERHEDIIKDDIAQGGQSNSLSENRAEAKQERSYLE
jgi:hypothetical protein